MNTNSSFQLLRIPTCSYSLAVQPFRPFLANHVMSHVFTGELSSAGGRITFNLDIYMLILKHFVAITIALVLYRAASHVM